MNEPGCIRSSPRELSRRSSPPGVGALFAALSATLLAAPGAAQETHQHERQPYAGLEGRDIKALSDQEQRDLLEGEGMGLALAAELNGYPGPKHVLELADSLSLDAGQRAGVEAVRQRMRERALELGRRIVHAEGELESLFAAGAATAAEVQERSEAIGRLRGRLRAVHLVAHLKTRLLLTDAQLRRYAELRGYAGGHEHGEAEGGSEGHAGAAAHRHGEPPRR